MKKMSEVKSINLSPGEMYVLNTNLTDKPKQEVEFLQKVNEDELFVVQKVKLNNYALPIVSLKETPIACEISFAV